MQVRGGKVERSSLRLEKTPKSKNPMQQAAQAEAPEEAAPGGEG